MLRPIQLTYFYCPNYNIMYIYSVLLLVFFSAVAVAEASSHWKPPLARNLGSRFSLQSNLRHSHKSLYMPISFFVASENTDLGTKRSFSSGNISHSSSNINLIFCKEFGLKTNSVFECLLKVIHGFRSWDLFVGDHSPRYINRLTNVSARASTEKFAVWAVTFVFPFLIR